jgi:hypothetical protein
VGLAGVINGITRPHQAYFDAGGLGILVGDGRLPLVRLNISVGQAASDEHTDVGQDLLFEVEAEPWAAAGERWGRPSDTVGLAGVINGITRPHQAYFDAGGLGPCPEDKGRPTIPIVSGAYYDLTVERQSYRRRQRQAFEQDRSRPDGRVDLGV